MRTVPQMTLTAVLISILLTARPSLAGPGLKPLFASDDVINLTISGPFGSLSRKTGAPSVPALLKVEGPAPETLPITLSTRGITRRLQQICSFPPLRITFTQKPAKTSIFVGQRSLKLVTHCQASERYQQGVLLEYAAYRLYQALTHESFGARIVKVSYTEETGRTVTTRLGFFIEDINDVARRNGQMRVRGVNHISVSQLDPNAAARFAMFQYMISNLDWAMTAGAPSLDCCHNSRLLDAQGATTGLIGIPYDFDYSGLVDAPYAVPPDGIHVANVRVRRYRGFCQHNAQAKAIAAELGIRRANLLSIVDRTPELNETYRKKADSYLGDFFDKIGSPRDLAEVLGSCVP